VKTLSLALIAGLALMLALCGCTQAGTGTTTPIVTTPGSGIANPAAVYCTEQQGTRYEIRTNPDGSQYGVCILPNGTVCDEWAYYRGGCAAAAAPAVTTTAAGIANPSATYCIGQNLTYETRTDANGSQYGVCLFPNGKECDAWAYYRGECNETTAK